MNILFVTAYPPSRIRVRSFELLRGLAKREHNITLATLWTSAEDRQELDALRAAGINVVDYYLPTLRSLTNTIGALTATTPLQAHYSWHPGFAKRLVDLALDIKADIVHVEHLRAARYGLYLKEQLAAAHRPTPVIWDSVDCITHLFRQAATQSHSLKSRLVTQLELGRTSRYEGWLVGQFDRTLVTSATDKEALLQLAAPVLTAKAKPSPNQQQIEVLPNGVDLEYFTPADEAGQQVRQATTLIFSGKMSYHANVTAAHYLVNEIMPLVWQECPEVDLWIVGKDPTRDVSELTATESIKTSKMTGKVVVTGTVPDLRVYLRKATIAVAPLRYGAGIQNKVLEAMACGIPVIATPQAVAALHVKDGEDLLVGHTAHEFAQAILTLLASPTQQMRLGQAGRTYVQAQHAWSTAVTHLETIYNEALHTVPFTAAQPAYSPFLSTAPDSPREQALSTPVK